MIKGLLGLLLLLSTSFSHLANADDLVKNPSRSLPYTTWEYARKVAADFFSTPTNRIRQTELATLMLNIVNNFNQYNSPDSTFDFFADTLDLCTPESFEKDRFSDSILVQMQVVFGRLRGSAFGNAKIAGIANSLYPIWMRSKSYPTSIRYSSLTQFMARNAPVSNRKIRGELFSILDQPNTNPVLWRKVVKALANRTNEIHAWDIDQSPLGISIIRNASALEAAITTIEEWSAGRTTGTSVSFRREINMAISTLLFRSDSEQLQFYSMRLISEALKHNLSLPENQQIADSSLRETFRKLRPITPNNEFYELKNEVFALLDQAIEINFTNELMISDLVSLSLYNDQLETGNLTLNEETISDLSAKVARPARWAESSGDIRIVLDFFELLARNNPVLFQTRFRDPFIRLNERLVKNSATQFRALGRIQQIAREQGVLECRSILTERQFVN